MPPANIKERIDRGIKGIPIINIVAETQNYDLAQQIVADKQNQEHEEKGLLVSQQSKKEIAQYFGKRDLADKLLEIQPLYYDENKIWWCWNEQEFRWCIVDEIDILNYVRELSSFNTVKAKDRGEILEALRQESRKRKPKQIKKSWVQFKDLIIDIETGEEIKASPEYFVTNPIPYSLHKERYVNTPKMDEIFAEWVGEEYVKTLYQIISYCLIPNYLLNRIFCFIGGGMNGKSCFLALLRKFIGESNCCSTELDTLISSRFEVTRLHKKLVCQMGETNFNEINQTSLLKKLTGGDLIGFEYKNKNPFEETNYAKIIIATNNLPTTDDKTIGFYRRWLIIDFPNQFSEKKDILKDIPEEEYEALAVKCLSILKDLLDVREFHKEGCIEDRAKKYEEKSDPIEKFLKENIVEDSLSNIQKWEFTKRLNDWCISNKFRQVTEQAVNKKMKDKKIDDGRAYFDWFDGNIKTSKQIRCWLGVKWK